MKRKPALVVGLIAFLGLCGLVVRGARAQSGVVPASSAPLPKMAEEQYKNIQILKGIPADQLMPGMQFIAASLGVGCEFCHVSGAFEKDDKQEKQTARKMMTMMFAINKNNFEGHRDVTCYSCHRGSPKPVGTPLVTVEEPRPPVAEAMKSDAKPNHGPATTGPNGPSADQLFDKYLQAVGGTSAVERITSRVMKGTITFGDRNIPIDIFSKDPEKRISFTHTPDGDSVTAFDGHAGWLGFPGRPAREMHGQELDAAAMDADLHFATHLKAMFGNTQVQGIEKVEDRDAFVVIGRREEKPPLRMYFDQQSGLLVRLVRYAETPVGLLPTQIDYADYREAEGVKIPFRWTLARTNGRFTIQLSDVRENVPVDDAKFAKPAPTPEGKKDPSK
jgi:photosynthetic reaction center cytochrome c subunit